MSVGRIASVNPKNSQTAIQRSEKHYALGLLTGLLIITCLLSLGTGAVTIEPLQIIAILGHTAGIDLPWNFTPEQHAVLTTIRSPRLVLGLLVGGTLAVSGAAMQGLFRNPLADPGLIGISSGAALAAVSVIVLGPLFLPALTGWLGSTLLPLAAFSGGFAVTLLVYRLATVNGTVNIATLLLAGIAINALSGSVTGLLVYLANDEQLRSLTFWSMGSLGGVTWPVLLSGLPFFLLPLIMLPMLSRALNALLLGEAEAGHLGFPVETIKTVVIILVALGVGVSVALSGIIGFIGLVTPHVLRLWLGPDHRILVPGSALLGATLLLSADLLARSVAAPAEIPIGIITGLLGSPFFLWLLLRLKLMGD
ncbi:MAG: iron ABC transporter permease [Methylomicrobium sp.]|nr:iron ABC transporter permease [Methylomicrobium sp.]